MNPPHANPPEPGREIDASIREAAARWIVRRDRGLSATESIEFELWLAADERHVAAVNRSGDAWAMLDRLPDSIADDRVVRARFRGRPVWIAFGAVAAALVAAAYFLPGRLVPEPARPATPAIAAPTRLVAEGPQPRVSTLSDGTVVRLNAGSEVLEQFTPGERRVEIARGEAHFNVTKNPARPFIVRAGNVEVRAVGTAFNVNLQSASVEVLVTEGAVQLGSSPGSAALRVGPLSDVAAAAAPDPRPPVVAAGERALITLASAEVGAAVVVSKVRPDEVARALAWQSPLLRLGGATLAELAGEFERQTGQRIVLDDPELAQRRVGGRFRADDVEGFVRLLEENYGVKSRRTADGTILLEKSP